MKSVTIVGTWRATEAKVCEPIANELGEVLAKKGYAIISGGGEGVSKCVVTSYRANGGKQFTAFLPAQKYMRKVGEKAGPKPNKLIRVKNADYPERNMVMVRNSKALIALHGGLGTLAEIIHAVKDYGIPVAVIDYGKLAYYIKSISDFDGKVFLAKNAAEAVKFIERA